MRVKLTSAGMALLAVAGAVLLTLMSTASSLVVLAARTTVLVMGGSGDPLTTDEDGLEFVEEYLGKAVDNFVQPASTLPGSGIPGGGTEGYNPVAVITPEEFAPDVGTLTFDESVAEGLENLDACIVGPAGTCVYNGDVSASAAPALDDVFVVFGYSQSATIATFEKRELAATYADGEGPVVSFVLIGNGNRPNGGFLARGPEGVTIPLGLTYGGATFSGPTPTDTQYPTVDFAIQYDLWADGPVNPLNLLAWANAMMAVQQLHRNYPDYSLDDPGIIDQGQYGDTSYYLAATETLPLLTPLEAIPLVGEAMAQTLDPFFRVIVEAAYDRETSPGEPTSWNIFYGPDPIEFVCNLALSIPTGLDNGIEYYFDVRPFGTTVPGPYGIGGPEVTWLNPPAEESEESGESDAATDTGAETTADAELMAATTSVSVDEHADATATEETETTEETSEETTATETQETEETETESDTEVLDEPTESDEPATDSDEQDGADTVEQDSPAETQGGDDDRSDDGANDRRLVGARTAASTTTSSASDTATSAADSGSDASEDD